MSGHAGLSLDPEIDGSVEQRVMPENFIVSPGDDVAVLAVRFVGDDGYSLRGVRQVHVGDRISHQRIRCRGKDAILTGSAGAGPRVPTVGSR